MRITKKPQTDHCGQKNGGKVENFLHQSHAAVTVSPGLKVLTLRGRTDVYWSYLLGQWGVETDR